MCCMLDGIEYGRMDGVYVGVQAVKEMGPRKEGLIDAVSGRKFHHEIPLCL